LAFNLLVLYQLQAFGNFRHPCEIEAEMSHVRRSTMTTPTARLAAGIQPARIGSPGLGNDMGSSTMQRADFGVDAPDERSRRTEGPDKRRSRVDNRLRSMRLPY
jgi:hypothetical protein